VDKITLKRFNDKIYKTPTCWLWIGAKTMDGYGRFGIGSKVFKSAHRLSYELHLGPIPEGYCIMHKCDTPCCVNPEHLSVGTAKDNSDDMISKGRSRHPSGDTHPHTKISELTIKEIYAKLKEESRKSLARQYGINYVTLCGRLKKLRRSLGD